MCLNKNRLDLAGSSLFCVSRCCDFFRPRCSTILAVVFASRGPFRQSPAGRQLPARNRGIDRKNISASSLPSSRLLGPCGPALSSRLRRPHAAPSAQPPLTPPLVAPRAQPKPRRARRAPRGAVRYARRAPRGAVRAVRCARCGARGAVRHARCARCAPRGAVRAVRYARCAPRGAVRAVRARRIAALYATGLRCAASREKPRGAPRLRLAAS